VISFPETRNHSGPNHASREGGVKRLKLRVDLTHVQAFP
jgi:hypothetical protein